LSVISVFGEAPQSFQDDVKVVDLEVVLLVALVYQQQVSLELDASGVILTFLMTSSTALYLVLVLDHVAKALSLVWFTSLSSSSAT